jgi:hypothetical protein
MKTSSLLFGLLLSSHAFAAEEPYVNFIRQTQQETGVVWSMPVSSHGTAASPLVLEGKGSVFQLWTIEQAATKDYLLDQKLVGAYLPVASIAVTTLDPYTKIPRTRADQPFTVTYQISGLLSGPGVPDAATRVLMEHYAVNYTAGQKSMPLTSALSGKPLESAYIATNGTVKLSFPVTSLTAADPTQATGEEHFVIHALSDGSLSQTQVAAGTVQVWPVASGSIAGVTDGQRIRYSAPPLTVTLDNLYPSSYTWLQVYAGKPKLNSEGVTLEGSQLVLDQDTPQSDILSVSRYDKAFPEDGTYTIELLTQTPFGIDRLHYVTVEIDRTLQIRAQISDIEQ